MARMVKRSGNQEFSERLNQATTSVRGSIKKMPFKGKFERRGSQPRQTEEQKQKETLNGNMGSIDIRPSNKRLSTSGGENVFKLKGLINRSM